MLYLISIQFMLLSLPKTKKQRGSTLIGILVALAIFSILGQAVFTLASSSFELVSFNRARITARHLAQEKIEFIRNLPYDDVGTSGGIPSGTIPQQEHIIRNKLDYLVKTSIIYIDDPFDQQTPGDLLPTDYKSVRVEVSWQGVASSRKNPVVFLTHIVPKGVETTAGGGTLSIFVFDAQANPVPQAQVTIYADTVTPTVNLTLNTADNGRAILPGASPCISCYEITVTKAGYSTQQTYSTSQVANPSKPHQTVLAGDLTEISFTIDILSNLNIISVKSREENFEIYPNILFQLRGEKIIGTDAQNQPVYKFDQDFITDSSGTISVNNIEWDNYRIIVPETSGLDISGTNPLLPIILQPNSTIDAKFALATQTTHSLLLSFTDNSKVPIASVSATLSDGASYQETKLSGFDTDPDFGQTFFSDLSQQIYTLTATASGYLDFSGSISVDQQTQENVVLDPS
jgi:hypothetical protein